MKFSMAAYLLILMLVAYPSVHAVPHLVGNDSGWSKKTDLAAWASTQIFTVGDTIVFLYNSHNQVDIVTEDDYNSCSTAHPLKSYSNALTSIPLDVEGPVYFIDPIGKHCKDGMKLAIYVHANGVTPYVPGDSNPTRPIGYLTPNPFGAGSSKPSNNCAFVLLLVGAILLMS